MPVITREKYKTLARITTTDHDDLIDEYIVIVQDDIIQICNYDFGAGTAEEDFPTGMIIYAANMISHLLDCSGKTDSVTSEKIGNYSYTKQSTASNGYPLSIMSGLSKWRRVSQKTGTVKTHYRELRYE